MLSSLYQQYCYTLLVGSSLLFDFTHTYTRPRLRRPALSVVSSPCCGLSACDVCEGRLFRCCRSCKVKPRHRILLTCVNVSAMRVCMCTGVIANADDFVLNNQASVPLLCFRAHSFSIQQHRLPLVFAWYLVVTAASLFFAGNRPKWYLCCVRPPHAVRDVLPRLRWCVHSPDFRSPPPVVSHTVMHALELEACGTGVPSTHIRMHPYTDALTDGVYREYTHNRMHAQRIL